MCQNNQITTILNNNFFVTGILSTSNELRFIQTFLPKSTYSCFVILRLVHKKGKRELKSDTLILLNDKDQKSRDSSTVLEEIEAYLKSREESPNERKKDEISQKKDLKLQGERE